MTQSVVISNAADADIGRKGVWLRTHITQEGPYLKAVTYCVAGGRAECFKTKIDLRPIAKIVARYHKSLHKESVMAGNTIGFLSSLKKVVKKVGTAKLTKAAFKPVKKLTIAAATGGYSLLPMSVKQKIARSPLGKQAYHTGKAIIKSKTTGAIVSTAAVVYPPVGVPALAAYAAANTYLSYIEKGGAAYDILKRIDKKTGLYNAAKKLLMGKSKAEAAKMLAANPKLKIAISAGLAQQKKIDELKKRGVFTRLQELVRKKRMAQLQLAKLGKLARSGDINARKSARVLNLVRKNRQRLKRLAPSPAMPGLLITNSGKVVRGKFKRAASGQSQYLYKGAKALNPWQRAPFTKVAGSYEVGVGCGSCPQVSGRQAPMTAQEFAQLRELLPNYGKRGYTPPPKTYSIPIAGCRNPIRVGEMPFHEGLQAQYSGMQPWYVGASTSAHLPY